MVREHGSLTKDAETNQAAWEAVKGGAYGGIKVCCTCFCFEAVLRLPPALGALVDVGFACCPYPSCLLSLRHRLSHRCALSMLSVAQCSSLDMRGIDTCDFELVPNSNIY